jgi:hypothetical protein
MTSDQLSDFPELDEAKNAIERLRKKGFPKFENSQNIDEYIETISTIITQEYGILPNFMNRLPRKNFPFNIFRVRAINDFENINLFAQHSYPPLNFVGFGRCNFPKHPVFYGSNNAITSLLEVARQTDGIDKEYCISKWNVESDEDIIFQSFIQAKIIENSNYDELRESQRKKINEIFKGKLTNGQCDGIVLLLEYLDRCFISDSNYSVSACLAHRAFYPTHPHETDILMYPSIQTSHTGVNFAIHPNFVDNKMQLKRFYIMKFENYNPKTREIKFSFSRYGEVLRNKINWKLINPEDPDYKKVIFEDFADLFNPDSDLSFVKV